MCKTKTDREVKKMFQVEQSMRAECPLCPGDIGLSAENLKKLLHEHYEAVYWSLIHCSCFLDIISDDDENKAVNQKLNEIINEISGLMIDAGKQILKKE